MVLAGRPRQGLALLRCQQPPAVSLRQAAAVVKEIVSALPLERLRGCAQTKPVHIEPVCVLTPPCLCRSATSPYLTTKGFDQKQATVAP